MYENGKMEWIVPSMNVQGNMKPILIKKKVLIDIRKNIKICKIIKIYIMIVIIFQN